MLIHKRSRTKDGRALVLRRARQSDAEALIAAIDEVAREGKFFLRSRFRQSVEVERERIALARRQGNLFLVATVDGGLAGWLSMRRRPQEFRRHAAELGIGVRKECREIGVGKALLLAALEWAAKTKIERVELGVRASNQRALKLYEQLGFVEEGRRIRAVKDNHGAYDDEIIMVYRL